MVKCNKVDGEPCICELDKPPIKYMIETIVINLLKLVSGTITHGEWDELQLFVRMLNAGRYVRLYIEQLDRERDIIGDIILNTI